MTLKLFSAFVVLVLSYQAQAAERRASRCIYSDLSNTSYADGPCRLRDVPVAQGKLAAYTVTWPEGASPGDLRLVVVVDKQGEGAGQDLLLDGRPAVGFEMTKRRYFKVTKDIQRALIIEGQ